MLDCFTHARTPAGVHPPGQLPVWGAAAATSGGGALMQGHINVLLPAAKVAGSAVPLIAAAGTIDPGAGWRGSAR